MPRKPGDKVIGWLFWAFCSVSLLCCACAPTGSLPRALEKSPRSPPLAVPWANRVVQLANPRVDNFVFFHRPMLRAGVFVEIDTRAS